MNRFLVRTLLCLYLGGCGSTTTKPALDAQLRPILHRLDESGAVVFARVIELPSGRELYSDNDRNPAIPASNLKLSVSAATLDHFGPEHQVETYLAIDGDDLWLIGTGDPAAGDAKIAATRGELSTTMLDRWTQALLDRGIREIKGNLYHFDSVFEAEQIHPSWSRSYLTDWYAAPVGGLNFNDNCIDVTATAGDVGTPANFAVMPPVQDVQIVNHTRSVAAGTKVPKEGPDAPAIERAANRNVFTLTGLISGKTKIESKSITDPGAYFADALRTNLASHGITTAGKILPADRPIGGTIPPPAEKIVAVHRTPLRDILWRINKSSQNLFAEAMCKYLGRAVAIERGDMNAVGSWSNGSQAVMAFLARQGVDTTGYVIADGSGLSRLNRITALGQTQLLAAMSRHRYAKAFGESLAVAGVDGTIGKRMPDIKGRVFAKTGYIGGVRALSGYVQTNGDHWLAFSIIYNRIPDDVKPYEALQDEACRIMVNWREP